ncbi:unnamed protein product [Pelagomonas calceolata]|uniref:Uncharacterized protein n=1 Tax=Pelagomonas calceolata TaxID=35677 RepID=A0A8J2SFS8_9STRA|nr:unnamed protein product [Pelagomonas calceolata]
MPRRRQKKEGSPASPPRGRSQARTPDSSPRRRGAAPSPKTRALAFLATPPPVSMPPRPALALAYEDAAARELALDVAYESDETSEDPRLLPAIATEIEAYDDPKQISPGYSTSEGEDEACRLGCGDLSPYSTSEDEDHAAPLRGRGPLPSYRPSKLTRRSKALGARRRGKTVAFASEPLSVAILTPVSAVKPQRVAFSPVAPAEVLELSSVEVLPPRRWRRGPLFVLAVVLGALFANGLKTTTPATVSTMVRPRPTPLTRSLTTPLRPAATRLARVPVATPFPEPAADAVPLVVLAAATGAVAATGAPPAVRLVAAAAPRAARVLVTALR